jgi:cell division protease FtsH
VVLTEDFNSALERVVAGMESRRLMNQHEKRVVAYHEAGHALCSELLPSVEKVHKISIVPRGRALGYTLNLPEEDRYLKSKEELTEYLVVLLGGRVAEQIIFGTVTTGASDDLKKVNEISRAMVAEYGMGNSMSSRRLAIDDYSISDNTRRLVDDEQADITDVAYRHAHRLITDNRDKLEQFAQTLLAQEVLEREDIERIVGPKHVRPLESVEPGPARIAAAEPPEQVP